MQLSLSAFGGEKNIISPKVCSRGDLSTVISYDTSFSQTPKADHSYVDSPQRFHDKSSSEKTGMPKRNNSFLSRSMTYDAALIYALSIVNAKPVGDTFTFSELFAGKSLSFNARRLAGICNFIRQEGLIQANGYRRTWSQGREAGLAILWRRVENE